MFYQWVCFVIFIQVSYIRRFLGLELDNECFLGHFLLCPPVHLEDVHGGWEDEVPDGGHEGADHGRGEGGGQAQDAHARIQEGSR